jgi:tRNA(Ile)-lysidine synthase
MNERSFIVKPPGPKIGLMHLRSPHTPRPFPPVPKPSADLFTSKKLLRNYPRDHAYLFALSGGRDSIALLHQLLRFGYADLTLCHLNHCLRGRASQVDAKFVNKVAIELGLDLVLRQIDVKALAAKKKMSIETAGRYARYKFFAAVAKRHRCHTIFVAHHADDLVETFLLNLFRGAGLAGLSGMREAASRQVDGINLHIVRPMLGTWRGEIDGYVRKHRLTYREDRSNQSVDPFRNRMRHRVIPYLEKLFGRRLRQNIWRTAMIAAEEDDFWTTLLPEGGAELMVKPLGVSSVAVQRRVLHNWLRRAAVPNVGFDLIERIRALLDTTGRIAKTNLPRDRHVRRRAGKLSIE